MFLVLLQGTTELGSASLNSPLNSPINYLCILIRPPEHSLPQERQFQLAQPLLRWQMLQSFNDSSVPSLDLLLYVHVSLALGSPDLDPEYQMCLTTAQGSPHSSLLVMILLRQPKILLVLCVSGGLLMTCVHLKKISDFFSIQLLLLKHEQSVSERSSTFFLFASKNVSGIWLDFLFPPILIDVKIWMINYILNSATIF